MIAQVCDLDVGDFVWTGGDTHLYANHFEQAKLQLSREPLGLCQLKLNPEVKDLFDFKLKILKLSVMNRIQELKHQLRFNSC